MDNIKLGDSLDEAKATICGARQDSYGSPENSFSIIAAFWFTYLRNRDSKVTSFGPLTAKDVSNMMILFKVARCLGQKPHRDNYIDIQGYAAISADRLMGGEYD